LGQQGLIEAEGLELVEPGHKTSAPKSRVAIEYCTQCRWLARAAWLAQELLSTFEDDLGHVALVPGSGGVFVIRVDDVVVWDRKADGFPEPSAVKRLVRDRVAPRKELGHSEK
jgi:selenoprotein W-related protein